MIEPCPICENDDAEIMGDYRNSHPSFDGLKRVHCRICGMIYAAPIPSKKALDKYNSSFYTHSGQPSNPLAAAFFSGIARLRITYLERYLKSRNIKVVSLLEFGPGFGFFARNWLEKYPHTIYNACETDARCHPTLQKIGVHIEEESANAKKRKPVDLVVMSHVIEHISHPVDFIKKATRNLRKGGVIFIEVPCRDWDHKTIDEPHLLFFDKPSMKQLLTKLSFDDILITYHGQKIYYLRSATQLRAIYMSLRTRLINMGLVFPFTRISLGMEGLTDPLERAMVVPFKAHLEMEKPAWWLRAVARKV